MYKDKFECLAIISSSIFVSSVSLAIAGPIIAINSTPSSISLKNRFQSGISFFEQCPLPLVRIILESCKLNRENIYP